MEEIDHPPSMASPNETHVAPHPYPSDDFVESDPADPGSSIDDSTSTLRRTLKIVNVDGQTIDECFAL